MAELINLRQMRKQKSHAEKQREAGENRVKFGRTKSEKQRSATEKSNQTKKLDGHKRKS